MDIPRFNFIWIFLCSRNLPLYWFAKRRSFLNSRYIIGYPVQNQIGGVNLTIEKEKFTVRSLDNIFKPREYKNTLVFLLPSLFSLSNISLDSFTLSIVVSYTMSSRTTSAHTSSSSPPPSPSLPSRRTPSPSSPHTRSSRTPSPTPPYSLLPPQTFSMPSTTNSTLHSEDTVIISVLGQSIELLNKMDMTIGTSQVSIITFQVLGYDSTTIEKTIIIPSSCTILVQHYSRDNEPSGELIPFLVGHSDDLMQEELD